LTKIESTLLLSLHKTATATAIRYYILISCRFLQASQVRDGSGNLRNDCCTQLEPAHRYKCKIKYSCLY